MNHVRSFAFLLVAAVLCILGPAPNAQTVQPCVNLSPPVAVPICEPCDNGTGEKVNDVCIKTLQLAWETCMKQSCDELRAEQRKILNEFAAGLLEAANAAVACMQSAQNQAQIDMCTATLNNKQAVLEGTRDAKLAAEYASYLAKITECGNAYYAGLAACCMPC